MSGDIGIGKLIDQERHRDAIHVAVAPMIAAHRLSPGQHVGPVGDGIAGRCKEPVGIVDPFLRKPVEPGQRFYLFLYPGTITSLRHEWVHPAFGDDPAPAQPITDKAASEAWLRKYAERVNPYLWERDPEHAYQTLLNDMRNGTLTYHGIDMHDRSDLIDGEELRRHTEIVLGIKIDYDSFEYFSCTC